jgi:hypothetical protein
MYMITLAHQMSIEADALIEHTALVGFVIVSFQTMTARIEEAAFQSQVMSRL